MADKILENTVPVGETSNKLVRYNIITGAFIHRNKATRSQSWVTVNDKDTVKKYAARFEENVNLQMGLKGKAGDISSGPLVLSGPEGGKYARYPVGLKYGEDTDYVLFQFVEYQPPFA